jgi:hypothetical protein
MPIGNSGVGFSIHSALTETNGNINKTAMTVPHRAEPDTAFCERCVLIFKECSHFFGRVKHFSEGRTWPPLSVSHWKTAV